MSHVEVECTNVFEEKHSEEELRIIFTQKWVDFINQKEQQEN